MGDFDASGFDLERDLREKLDRYCDKEVIQAGEGLSGDHRTWWWNTAERSKCVLFERVAVVDRDFDDFDLLPLAVKDRDNRAKAFRKEHGDRCAELDAIPSTELRRRVEEIIEAHIDVQRDEWERLQTVEAAERETLATVVASISGARHDDGSVTDGSRQRAIYSGRGARVP